MVDTQTEAVWGGGGGGTRTVSASKNWGGGGDRLVTEKADMMEQDPRTPDRNQGTLNRALLGNAEMHWGGGGGGGKAVMVGVVDMMEQNEAERPRGFPPSRWALRGMQSN